MKPVTVYQKSFDLFITGDRFLKSASEENMSHQILAGFDMGRRYTVVT